MNILCFQHVPFEGPARIADWAASKGHNLTVSKLYDGGVPTDAEGFDWLVVMGGPMNVYEEEKHPWLRDEKRFIERAIKDGKAVLGVCLGSQLIADVLGARVRRNEHEEIGWFPVQLSSHASSSPLFVGVPPAAKVFHWHADTFDLPEGAWRVGSSAACLHQGFAYGDRVVGLQFHLELTPERAREMFLHCGGDVREGKFVQNPSDILADKNEGMFVRSNQSLFKILDALERVSATAPKQKE